MLPWQQVSPPRRGPLSLPLSRRSVRLCLLGLVIAVLAVSVYLVTRPGFGPGGQAARPAPTGKTAGDARPSIAVFPFANSSAEKGTDYLSAGITDELGNALARVTGLRVIAVSSLPADAPDVPTLGRRLGVASVLRGSVRKEGRKIRITVQLVTTRDGSFVWSQNYDRELREILAIESDVAARVTHALQVRLLAGEAARLGRQPTTSVEAYQAYLKGRHAWDLVTEAAWKKSIPQFQQAIRLDPGFAEAYSGLADTYYSLADNYLPPRRAMEEARKAARKALELDPTLAEARTSLAMIHYVYDFDWAGAEREFRNAISVSPEYPLAHHQYGWLLCYQGRYEEALAELKRAERLAPLSPLFTLDVNVPYTLTRRYDLAIAQCEKALDLSPDLLVAHFVLGWIHDVKGDYATAVTHLERVRALYPDPWVQGWLGHALGRDGRTAEARRRLAELQSESPRRWVPPGAIAFIRLGLGDNEGAMRSLEEAYRTRSIWLAWLKVEPAFDPLRSDPRFSALLKRVGLGQ